MSRVSVKRVSVVLGTRPEVIKLAPVILEGIKRGHKIRVILTGQHRHLAAPLLKFFGIKPSVDLDVMVPNQTLGGLSHRLLSQLDQSAESKNPDLLLVQGDTTSAFVAAYWAFCRRIPVGHVEAGLRTYDLDSPFPEEANRQLVGRLAHWHFAPTQAAARALRAERVSAGGGIHVVGNSGIDALQFTLGRLSSGGAIPRSEKLPASVLKFLGTRPLILVTAHRRESFGPGFERICRAIRTLADARPVQIVYPVHPNPNVRQMTDRFLKFHPQIHLCDPLPYVAFVDLMKRADLLLTDSGGVQEEAPTLRKKILVLRDKTERPEGVRAGFAKLVGTSEKKIVTEALRLLDHPERPKGKNPYGDGKTSRRIWDLIEGGRVRCTKSEQDPIPVRPRSDTPEPM